jgi:hypothetical protein
VDNRGSRTSLRDRARRRRLLGVTIASATTSRREDLTAAILEASGGLVSNAKALELAAAVKSANGRKPE